ncbi:protein disulfide-isomerase A2 [Esox lucius]|uniref:Protein disulfide-isomerase n=1 Tax=Esox lucius TaxID=8010 RepID=A0A3P8YM70_ESOLU|nr:protein disulfide-isomerase A2 [Esox lucius]
MRFYIVPLVAILVLCVPCNRAEDSAGPEQTDNVVQENSPEQTDNVVQENGPENSNHAAEGVEDPEKKDKTSDIEEEKDVMVLHIKNFHRALSENKFLLVEFYAPWCGHCQQLEPVYAEAAGLLKTERTVGEGGSVGVSLAKVDATEEKELAEEFDVGSFPTIKLFMNGDRKNPIDFTGKRTVKGIVQWLERRSGPSAVVLDSPAAAAEHIRLHNITVVGFFTSLESEAVKVFHNVAMEMVDTVFGVTTSPEVFQKYEVKNNRVVLFKKFDEGRADLPVSEEGKLDQDDLTVFIKNNSLELLIEFNEENADKIFGSKVHTHMLLFINSTMEEQNILLTEFSAVAKDFKGQVLFITIDVMGQVDHVLKYFGLSVSDVPAVRIINTDTVKKFNLIGQITAATLQTFCQGVLDGTVKPHLLSEDVPEDWDKGVVKVLVGKNFEAVVRDKNKNVFVEFYAPWCGHCKELAPVWEKLGEKYADHNDIIIAKMDATANEVEGVSVSGFPTLMYYPAGDDKEVEYGGTRDLETFIKFLDNGGQLPQEEVEQEEDIEEITDEGSPPEANETSKDEL